MRIYQQNLKNGHLIKDYLAPFCTEEFEFFEFFKMNGLVLLRFINGFFFLHIKMLTFNLNRFFYSALDYIKKHL